MVHFILDLKGRVFVTLCAPIVINVKSELTKGSTFTVLWPVKEK